MNLVFIYLGEECLFIIYSVSELAMGKVPVCLQPVCEVCGKSFAQKDVLKSHVKLIHLKISKTKNKDRETCDQCGKTFAHNVARHVRRVHGGQRDQRCDVCGKTFFDKTTLKNHVNSVHLKKPDVWKRRNPRPKKST